MILVSRVSVFRIKSLLLKEFTISTIIFGTSLACKQPVMPGNTPSTRPSSQTGTEQELGGAG
ncbi:MAG TPA: hypothetical protein VIS49_02680 [Cyclobacteriaceae bacterium]